MPRNIKKFLHDIVESISTIDEYLAPFPTMSSYAANKVYVDAVERRLAVIGEALSQADKLDINLPVSNKSKIIGLRHIMVHGYDVIDTATVWMICKKYLQELKKEIELILEAD